MIIWTIKLLGAVRRAIAGRKHPHQLAWAVAFGVLLGIVPHGNLLAVGLLILVLSLKLNHAMAGLVAIGTAFAASFLDPYSHQVGDAVLGHPRLGDMAANAWQWPLVPWTDLNNTVVMGSFLIGVVALVPIFLMTYPVFRMVAPAGPEPERDDSDIVFDEVDSAGHEIVVVDQGHKQIAKPHPNPQPQPQHPDVTAAKRRNDAKRRTDAARLDRRKPVASSSRTTQMDPADAVSDADQPGDEDSVSGNEVAVETRIDVIRMTDYRDAKPQTPPDTSGEDQTNEPQQPMDEALSYLLRQLRDSQQRKVA